MEKASVKAVEMVRAMMVMKRLKAESETGSRRGRQYKGRVGQTVQNVLAIQAPGTCLLLHFSPRTETLKPA
ncbi:hypothetical protein DTO166G4_2726 [Paecilomyces variotii]|nr:hypothetical protein DTO166G4_2726 [Paecilomyces variotii]KAJ9232845.1 hypothetical protein DTO166G5_6046 [Paecilomyces variotii]KAJ9304704.1 hypothetical protein DTO217A2_5815 [Paecilomyces variotii]KAJ9366957.1 hypothetical protein DTO282E5_8337 [Paecilomyces variotii]